MIRRYTAWSLVALVLGSPSTARAQGGPEVVVYFHTDAVGSVRMVTDANGVVVEHYDYLPFGEPWPARSTGQETRRYTGQEQDLESGLNYFGARYYASLNGRFMRPDDPGYMNLVDPRTWNLYTYGYNNPLRFIDPSGHIGECPPDHAANYCSENDPLPDLGTILFWLNSLYSSLPSISVPSFNPTLGAPDPTCVNAAANTGMALGGTYIGYLGATWGAATGATAGTFALPGGGTVGGGFLGGTAGHAGGTAIGSTGGRAAGRIVGSIACASSAGQGGGGGGSGRSSLKPLHDDSSASKASLEFWHKKSTQEIVDSLKPGNPEALRVKPDGTIMNGNTRIHILRERGFNVDSLPRDVF